MEVKKLYQWARQPDGLYVIFDVEIMHPYDDRKMVDGKVKGRGRATLEDLTQAIENFQENVERGQRPRAFLGHHLGLENRTGVGFLDNLHMVGQDVTGDIVNIPGDMLEKIRKESYPYRSPEYYWDRRHIAGLALLSSQEPYFVYPMLLLDQQPVQIENMSGALARFQMRANFECSCGENSMADEMDQVDDQMVDEDSASPEKFDMEAGCKDIQERLGRIEQLLMDLFEAEEEEHGNQEGGEMPTETGGSEAPSSVAYQMNIMFQKLNRRLDKIESGQAETGFDAEVRSFCASTGMNFDQVKGKLAKFSSVSDKREALNFLRAAPSPSYPMHQMTHNLERFQHQALSAKEKVVAKFSDYEDQANAKLAAETYCDTIFQNNRRDAAAFCRIWHVDIEKDPMSGLERYVENAVEMCREDPNWMRKQISL